MDIKSRVLTSAKTSYAKYGFKKGELEQLSSIIAANLTDESTDEEIQAAISAAEGYAQMMQSVYNRGVSETNDKYKGYIKPAPKPDPDPTPAPTPDPTQPLTLDEVRKLIEQSNADRQKAIDAAVAKAVATFEEREQKARLGAMLQGHEKLKSIPEVFRSKYTLDKEENLDALADKIEADWTSTKQALIASGQFVEAPPKADPASEVDDFVKTMQGFAERNGASK